ncbi:hypothetical protein CTI14_21820 [Methylobacterium radiotolerans]|nr:hypothetical protein CTI14_21820 [Methylobacterium radiotolerans]
MRKELLPIESVRQEFSLGRDLASHLVKLLPHVKVGRSGRGERLLVRREDLNRLLEKAAREDRTLWSIARTYTPDTLREWLNAPLEVN